MNRRRLIYTLSICFIMIITSTVTSFANSTPYDIEIIRYGGATRYETANIISDAVQKSASGNIDTVIITSGSGYADALAGGPLGTLIEAPILLSTPTGLDQSTINQIKKLNAKSAYILGGTGAVPANVETQLTQLGISKANITRIAGSSRFGTAVAVGEKIADIAGTEKFSYVYIAYANNYPDALSISTIAAQTRSPILYAPASGKLDKETFNFISNYCDENTKITLLGGPAVISQSVAFNIAAAAGVAPTRLYGQDRYETSAKIFKEFNSYVYDSKICMATGSNFPDALAGSVFAGIEGYGILLVNNNSMHDAINYTIRGYNTERAYVFGGTGVVSDQTVKNTTRIPPKQSWVISESRYLGSVRNPYVAQEDSNVVKASVIDYTYTITPGDDNATCTLESIVTWHVDSSTIPGQAGIYVVGRVYDESNHKVAAANSETAFAKQGDNFVTKLTFTNVPMERTEFFIYDIRLGGKG